MKLFTLRSSLFTISIAAAVLMLLIGYSYMVNPNKFALAGPVGLLFPAILAANIAVLLLFLLFRKYRLMLVPFVGLLLAYAPVRLYCPVNLPSKAPADCIDFMSYNVLSFKGIDGDYSLDENNPLVQYLIEQRKDIVCTQEDNAGLSDNATLQLKKTYPHIHHVKLNDKSSTVGIYTKFPVLQIDTIDFGSVGNLAAGFLLDTPEGRLRVINCHLETNGLTAEDKHNFSSMMKGKMESDSVKDESISLFAKLARASKVRSHQMEKVMAYVSRHKGENIVLCGDFNENPLSYPHYLANRQLTDCYTTSATGLGWSYCHNAMRVRIDNIFCSQSITPFNCHVDNTTPYSDHYPITTTLTLAK